MKSFLGFFGQILLIHFYSPTFFSFFFNEVETYEVLILQIFPRYLGYFFLEPFYDFSKTAALRLY